MLINEEIKRISANYADLLSEIEGKIACLREYRLKITELMFNDFIGKQVLIAFAGEPVKCFLQGLRYDSTKRFIYPILSWDKDGAQELPTLYPIDNIESIELCE